MFKYLLLVYLFFGRHAPDELSERRSPLGWTIKWRCQDPVATARWCHFVLIGRSGWRRRDSRIGRKLTTMTTDTLCLSAVISGTYIFVIVFTCRRERVIDVRNKPRQWSAHHGPFWGWRRSVREWACGQTFGEFRAFQFNVRCGHSVGSTTKLVKRKTASDEPRSLFSGENYKKNRLKIK